MKKITFFIISFMAFMFLSANTYASPYSMNTREYFNDGSYIVTSIEDEISDFGFSICSATTTKSKTLTYYNSNDVALWYVKVTGTFTYGNGTSTCTTSSVTAGSYATTWKITSKSASKNGSTASATATAKQYLDGVVIDTITRTVRLTCNPTGEFS